MGAIALASVNGDQGSHRRIARVATAKKELVWAYGVIPYEIHENFSGAHRVLFKRAMKFWENHACIKFVERNPEDPDHVNFILFTICSYARGYV